MNNRFVPLVLAMLLLTVLFLPAEAGRPVPTYYAVDESGECWLPDGNARPTNALGIKQNFQWVRPLRLEATCWGHLPKGAPRPKETLKLTFENTGYVCQVVFELSTMATSDYSATVYPNGTTQIACRVDLE